MKNILEIFKKIADNEGITITALEAKIGASKGVLSRAINNDTDIQSKWLLNLVENYPLYNPEWLLTGNGEMLKKEAPNATVETAERILDKEMISSLKQTIADIERINAMQEKVIMAQEKAIKLLEDALKAKVH